MDELIEQMLKLHALGAMRADDAVQRQAVMSHGVAAHFMDLGFVRDAMEPSVVEAIAMQGLSAASLAAQAAGCNMVGKAGQ